VSASVVVRRTQPALENTCTSSPWPYRTTPVAPVSKKQTTRPACRSVRARPPSRARTASIVDLGRLAEGSFTGSETRRDTQLTLTLPRSMEASPEPKTRGQRVRGRSRRGERGRLDPLIVVPQRG